MNDKIVVQMKVIFKKKSADFLLFNRKNKKARQEIQRALLY